MTALTSDLKKRAQRRHATIVRRRRDPRYRRVLSRFVGAGLLDTLEPVTPHRKPIGVADALWAGELEPRILELLPALLVKRPSFFRRAEALPRDLAEVVHALERNKLPPNFRGIPGEDLARWVPRVGRKNKLPSRLKSFRFTSDDLRLLAQIRDDLGTTETEVVRRGLRELAGKLLELDPPVRRAHS